MYCNQCGSQNADTSRFCEHCGADLQAGMNVSQPQAVPKKQMHQGKGKQQKTGKKKKGIVKKILIWIVVILLLAAIVAAVVFALQKKKEKDFKAEIDTGEKYLEELDYEQAETAYLAAIEVDPKQEEPYLKLAEIYSAQNRPEKAVKILEQGKLNTDSREIKEKYSLYSYVSDVLIPEYGECREDRWECAYEKVGDYTANAKYVHDQAGVITSRIMDFDGDKKDELLVLMLKNDVATSWPEGEKGNVVVLQMYEYEKGKVVLADEMQDKSMLLGGRDQEMDGAFLKEHDGKIYLCGGGYGLVYLGADGSSFTSWVLTYDGKFQVYTGMPGGTSGSEFSYIQNEAREMADKLKTIGLVKAAEDVERTGMMRMTYDDEEIDMLFRISGRNLGGSSSRYFKSHNLADLGKVVFRFWIGEKNISGEAEKVPADEIEALKKEFELLEQMTKEENESASYGSQMELNHIAGNVYEMWSQEVQVVYEILEGYLPKEEADTLFEEQSKWEENSRKHADEVSDEFRGGTIYSMIHADAMYEQYHDRAYELLKRLETLAE